MKKIIGIFYALVISLFIVGCNEKIEVNSISLNETSDINLVMGDEERESIQLVATIDPANIETGINWSTTNYKVARVDKDGLVRAVGEGSAFIIATTDNNKSASVKVNVTSIKSTSVEIDIDPVTSMPIGSKMQLSANVLPLRSVYDSLVWSSSNSEIMSVDQHGVVSAKAIGEAIITVKVIVGETTLTDTTRITVTEIPVDTIEIVFEDAFYDEDNEYYLLSMNNSYQLDFIINPEDATDKGLTWESDNETVVTVDENGKLQALSEGMATISVQTKYGKTDEIRVFVEEVELTHIELHTDSNIYETYKRKIALVFNNGESTPSNSEGIVWSIENSEELDGVVSIDQDGNLSIGVLPEPNVYTIKVVATYNAGEENEVKGEKNITINPITVNFENENVNTVEGKTLDLEVTINPTTYLNEDQVITFTSSDGSIATVDENGVLTALTEGEVTITASINILVDGEVITTREASISVVIDAAIPVTSISLEETELTIKEEETVELIYSIDPENATHKEVTFVSSDDSIATVDEDGVVTAHSVGTVTITVRSVRYDDISDSVTINVERVIKPLAVELDKEQVSLLNGETIQLIATLIKEEGEQGDITYPELIWTSSNNSSVKVDENGLLTAVGIGTATITVQTSNGKIATCEVTVNAVKNITSLSLSKTESNLSIDETDFIIVNIFPSDASYQELNVISSDEGVATVAINEAEPRKIIITANGVGEAIVTVSPVEYPHITLTFKVTVSE